MFDIVQKFYFDFKELEAQQLYLMDNVFTDETTQTNITIFRVQTDWPIG